VFSIARSVVEYTHQSKDPKAVKREKPAIPGNALGNNKSALRHCPSVNAVRKGASPLGPDATRP